MEPEFSSSRNATVAISVDPNGLSSAQCMEPVAPLATTSTSLHNDPSALPEHESKDLQDQGQTRVPQQPKSSRIITDSNEPWGHEQPVSSVLSSVPIDERSGIAVASSSSISAEARPLPRQSAPPSYIESSSNTPYATPDFEKVKVDQALESDDAISRQPLNGESEKYPFTLTKAVIEENTVVSARFTRTRCGDTTDPQTCCSLCAEKSTTVEWFEGNDDVQQISPSCMQHQQGDRHKGEEPLQQPLPKLTRPRAFSARSRKISFPPSTRERRPSIRIEARSLVEGRIGHVCDIHESHGSSALEEEEEALAYSVKLAALKGRRSSRSSSRLSASDIDRPSEAEIEEAAGAGVGEGGQDRDASRRTNSNADEDEDTEDDDDDEYICVEAEGEEAPDNCLSGICLPRSQFFQTSVICSNTMTRDGLANERTFLSWLNLCSALCLVSFSFMSRSLSLEALVEPREPDNAVQLSKLSRVIGYVCFSAALFAAIYSLFKYLRNIRRISTRYPFAQAGPWTFTLGMVIGTIIMVILVLIHVHDM